ncbi:MAG: hypothetical protein JWM43_119 [Acidobacteriaceae bacterium]|nr:hypothetical protein [Acidobacteriaceae bacterium]
MANGKKIALGATLVALLAVGGELLYLHHERNKPIATKAPERERIADDDLVFLKQKRPASMTDMKDLFGTTVWISAGGQLEYYAVVGKSVQYAKSAGTLLGAQELKIKGAVEQVAPKTATFRIPGGDKQVSLLFEMTANPGKQYAVPVGYRQEGQYTFYTDEIFFYDDPHELYKHWGPEIWKAVDEHRVILGMNERQVQLALGQVSKSTSKDYGNRMVVFANLGKPMAVTFVKNKATAMREDQGY